MNRSLAMFENLNKWRNALESKMHFTPEKLNKVFICQKLKTFLILGEDASSSL